MAFRGKHVARVTTLLTWVGVSAVALLMLDVLFNVLTRALGMRIAALPPTLDTVSYWWMPVAAVVGFVVAQARDEHIEVPLVQPRHPLDLRLLFLLRGLVTSVFLALVTYFSVVEALQQQGIGERTAVARIVIWPTRWLLALSLAALTLLVIVRTVESLKARPRMR